MGNIYYWFYWCLMNESLKMRPNKHRPLSTFLFIHRSKFIQVSNLQQKKQISPLPPEDDLALFGASIALWVM